MFIDTSKVFGRVYKRCCDNKEASEEDIHCSCVTATKALSSALAHEMTRISEEGLGLCSDAHNAEVTVFFVLHGFLGDSVARQEVVGSSRPTIYMRQCFFVACQLKTEGGN